MAQKLSILITDDNSENIKVLSNMLKNEGYKIRIAMNGEQAIKSVEIKSPDLILMDIQMPKMDGYEACERILKNHKDIPIVFISAINDNFNKMKAFKSGGVDYLTKPFHLEEILIRIKTHLALREKTIALEIALKNLSETQNQLVQSEKMASLGLLSAGIAHEINNPINFISVGVDGLEQNFKDLEKVLEKYETLFTAQNGTRDKILGEIADLKNRYRFDEVKTLIPQLIDDIKLGAKRTAEIVKGLQSFSRNDGGEMVLFNIHEGLESSLKILHNEYKNDIQIEKFYGSSVPHIKCHPSKLNQVFLNILMNAIDALDTIERNKKISITTKSMKDHVKIVIKDNGPGMTKEVQKKIFDPFFTTKEIGQGTGLGLSISHGIIKSHGGLIEIKSKQDKGTEFFITLLK